MADPAKDLFRRHSIAEMPNDMTSEDVGQRFKHIALK